MTKNPKAERPKLVALRLYKKHRFIMFQLAKLKKVSQAQIVRLALEKFDTNI